MSLSDIIGRLGLETAPKIALILFLAAFAMILVGALARSRKKEFDRASRLPLEDDDPPGVVRGADDDEDGQDQDGQTQAGS